MRSKLTSIMVIIIIIANLIPLNIVVAADDKIEENVNIQTEESKQILEDGIYEISMYNSNYSNLCLEVANGSKDNCANIQLGKWISKYYDKDKFKVIYNKETGYYTIKSVVSGKALDVQWGSTEVGANIWQYESNGSKAQQWKIEQNSDGSYTIISALSGLILDISGGTMKSGQNVQVYTSNNTNAQKFNFVKQDETIPEQVIEDGIYEISMYNSEYSNLCIEVANGETKNGTNIQLGTWINKYYDRDKFKLTYNEETGYYTIKSVASGKVLDVQNGSTDLWTNVWQYEANGSKAQQWEIDKNDDGSYKIISALTGLALDVSDGVMKTGQNIQVFTSKENNAQKFNFVKQDETIPEQVIEDGIYEISMYNSEYSNLCLEVANGETKNGANIQLGTWINKYYDRDKFKLTYNSETGYYTIKSIASGKVLDVQGGVTSAGTNVWQYESNGSKAQQWEISKNSDGSYTIISALTGLALDISGGTMKIGQNVQVYASNNTNAQKFNFTCLDNIVPERTIEDGTYKIEAFSNQNLSVDVQNDSRQNGGNIVLGEKKDTISNEFNLKYNSETGLYTIVSVNSGKVLDVQNGSKTVGTNVWQYEENESNAQKWEIKKNSDGSYTFISSLTGFALDIQDANLVNGQNIQVYTPNETNAQKFVLDKQETKTEKYIEEGLYKIATRNDTSKGFDIDGASKSDGANLQVWTYVKVPQQQFNIYYRNGYYYIININSNKAMQVVDSEIKQYDLDVNNDNQKWIAKRIDDKEYCFVSKSKELAITANSTDNGTHLVLSTYTSKNNQKFVLENAGIYIDESKYPGIKQLVDNLKTVHPTWNFEILYTGLDFATAVNGEYSNKQRNLVSSYTYKGDWIDSNPYSSGGWYSASYNAIAYFMDARNFLNEIDVFQFLNLNSYDSTSASISGIQSQVNSTFLSSYASDINSACVKQNVNPYYIIARLFQEQGRNGTTIGTGMDGGDGKTYYNPFNIGAVVGNDYATALAKAKEKGWDSMEKAIIGGIDFLKLNWLNNYQNTLYLNKFDIDLRSGSSLYTHQYMQNLSAAYSEARTLRSCYSSTNALEGNFTFVIPVYENMPSSISVRPSGTSSSISSESGPKDVKVVDVSSTLNIRSDSNTSSTIIAKIEKGTHLLSVKRAVNGNWHQVVLDDGTVGYASGDYLQIVSDVTNCNTNKTTSTNVNLRIGPGTSFDSIGCITSGTTVTVINEGTYDREGYWWSRVITSSGTQGFIASKYLN